MGLIAACIFVVYAVAVTPALVISRKSEIIEFFVHEILSARISAVAGQGFSTNCLKLPLSHYKGQNIVDIFSKGFRNVKLRSRADLYVSPYDAINFTWFPRNLTINVWRMAWCRSFPGTITKQRHLRVTMIGRIT